MRCTDDTERFVYYTTRLIEDTEHFVFNEKIAAKQYSIFLKQFQRTNVKMEAVVIHFPFSNSREQKYNGFWKENYEFT